MWNNQTISVIMPAYNEEANVAKTVGEFLNLSYFLDSRIVDEVIVVNNNSTDNTKELARDAGAKVVTEEKQGYGNALQRGLRETSSDLVILCEPDGTFNPKDIVKLLSYSEEFEMVCGTRTYPGMIWEDANMKWFLRLGNYAVAKLMEILYKTHSLSDCGCTFRLIRGEAVRKILPDLFVGKSHFLPNMVIAAHMNNIDFIEIPVSYRGRVGESKITGTLWGAWKTGLAMIWLIIRMWPSFIARRKSSQ
ncbi:MAG: glycosyltransferase family 2 protein [Rhodospirillales bacterium]|nr:glycosyltransferase family 2 protein [Rhodospirillales bacterium]